jgi:hypothetical protein
MSKTWEEHGIEVERLRKKRPQLVKNLESLIADGTKSDLDTVFDMVNVELWRRPSCL